MRQFLCLLLPVIICSWGCSRTESGTDSVGQGRPSVAAEKQEPPPNGANFGPLTGKSIGIVVRDGRKVLATEGRSGPPDALCFSRDGKSYQWMYVVTKDDPGIGELELPVGEKGDKSRSFRDLSLADARSAKHWDLSEPYSLVEVEVNGGEGSPATDSFVATRVRRIDGTPEFPLDVGKVMRELQKSYKAYVLSQQKAVDNAMNAAQQQYLKDQKPTGPREESEIVHVTWRGETERLQVRFSTRVTDGIFSIGKGTERKKNGGAVAERQGEDSPRADGVRYGTMYGIEFGMVYEVAKSGKHERSQPIAIQSFKKDLPPPGG